ncbi:MAG: putative DNA modification/repair radical SAM protein [Clostridia bacterium]
MEILEKLKILADSAKYDVSCASSGVSRSGAKNMLGNCTAPGVCHSFTADGRCISLLKILYTNVCIYDCSYCLNRQSNDIPRACFTPQEVCEITTNFYLRNYIEGLFLSSGIIISCDHTTEMILQTVTMLREEYRFNGYIHVKIIPGADKTLIERLGRKVDRMSVNIELPSESSLKLLAPQKSRQDLVSPMRLIRDGITEYAHARKTMRSTPSFVPGGQSTQMIVGASPDSDLSILKLTESLYDTFKLKRVYFSAYIPLNSHPLLPSVLTKPPLLREHRLYQADFLLRFYGFKAGELLNESHPLFDIHLDPKAQWALRNLHLFPVEINKAPYSTLLRVPGIGTISAKKIVQARRYASLTLEDLKKLGAVVKRAKYFVTCKGFYDKDLVFSEQSIKHGLLLSSGRHFNENQISVFSMKGGLLDGHPSV